MVSPQAFGGYESKAESHQQKTTHCQTLPTAPSHAGTTLCSLPFPQPRDFIFPLSSSCWKRMQGSLAGSQFRQGPFRLDVRTNFFSREQCCTGTAAQGESHRDVTPRDGLGLMAAALCPSQFATSQKPLWCVHPICSTCSSLHAGARGWGSPHPAPGSSASQGCRQSPSTAL